MPNPDGNPPGEVGLQKTGLEPVVELEGGEVGGLLDDDEVREGLVDDDGREEAEEEEAIPPTQVISPLA